MDYEIVVGLEIHAELSTKSKIYCGCTAEFGGDPNTHCCPICTGMPGTLPVLNKKVVEYAVKAGLATNCTISRRSKQDRKNYFYPDLPKAYQISQYDLPLCRNGYVNINIDGNIKKIGIERIHIEEDAGKLLHQEGSLDSLIDYNRSGVPLIEIVTKPDMRSAEEARQVVENIRAILQYIDVSDCRMELGSLRSDVNVSVMPAGSKELGTRTEMKNLNSLRSIVRAIEAEARRQIDVLESGGEIIQETRRWDDSKGLSYAMRSKEEVNDYRFFPEPDLVPVEVSDEWLEEIRSSIPELPESRKKRFMMEYELPEYDASLLISSKALADYFEEAADFNKNAKAISNWIMGDLMRILKERGLEAESIPFPAEYLAGLVALIDRSSISGTMARKVFERMFDTGKKPEIIVKEEGLEVICDEGALYQVVKKVLENNAQSVADYKKGKEKAFGFLVGQAMKESRGRADPQLINKLLKEELEKM